MRACPSCGRQNEDDARFCSGCGAQLPAAAQPGTDVRKTVTAVFCDVTGSTELGEKLDPESLRRVLSRYFEAMAAVLERHGGSLEKFIGDAVVAFFGVPVVHEDDALRAVRAAVEMRDALERLNDELEEGWGVRIAVRTGVNTGEVVVNRRESGHGLVLGDALNIAARLEQTAGPGEILVGAETYQLVRDAVDVEAVDPLVLKGKNEPVAAWRLLAVHPHAPGRARRLDSPLVGRTHERELLDGAYARVVRERACHLFTILGVAGAGKSRLVHEFLGGIRAGAQVARGRCLPYGEGITFWAVAEAIEQAVGASGPDDASARVRALLAEEQDAEPVAEVVDEVLGVGAAEAGPDAIAWAVRHLFERLARERPLVLVLDDVQWAPPILLDLVEHLSDWSRDAPLLVLCIARPELLDVRPTWGGGKLNATSVLLEPLNAAECAQLIENLLGRAALEPAASARIAAAAEGNPLFVEEFVRMLIDDGMLRAEGDRWVPTADLAALAVPATIQALLAARLDRLTLAERSLLERASVEGRVFHRGAVVALLPADLAATAPASLQALVRKELIRPDTPTLAREDAFRFRHLLIRDEAYRGVPKETRSVLHERFADWLEEHASANERELDAILGYHLEQAFRYRAELGPVGVGERLLAARAAARLETAGQDAFNRDDMPAAAALLSRSVELRRTAGPASVEILLELAEAFRSTGRLAEAEAAVADAIAEAERRGDSGLVAHATLDRLILQSLTDPEFRTSDLLKVAGETVPLLESLADDRGLSKAWRGIAEVHLTSCRWGASSEALERALVHARRAGDRHEARLVLPLLANALYWGPTPVSAGIARCEEILAAASGAPTVQANVHCYLGGFEAMRGDVDEAWAAIGRGRAIFEEVGHTLGLAAHAILSASVALLAGDPARAEAEVAPGMARLAEMGETGTLSSLAALAAEAMYEQGRLDESLALTETSAAAASEDDVAAQVAWRATRAKILAARGDDAADLLADEAWRLVAATDFLHMQGDVLVARAEVLRLLGRSEHLRTVVTEAVELYERKESAVAAARARSLLEASAPA